ncbi:MAG: hypothetical protein JWM95_2456 [Gemmatimonadetes bacterium]|nr:hypothetical protein [Gemmatimonadota bacterium]
MALARSPKILIHDTPAPSYGIAGLVGLAVFALYVITLAPTTAMWDASEYITAAYILGIPHPPGNPLFVLLGRVASLMPVGSVAVRVNLLAAFCSSMSAAIWFLVAERVLVAWSNIRWTRIVAAVTAALLGATTFTVWNQSVVNEKVYTVSLAFFAVVSWLTVRWCDDPDGPVADRLLVMIAYLIGLGYCNHPAGLLVGPAVAVAVIVRRPRTLVRWRLLLAGALAMVLGLTPFMVEPIRAAWHPALNEGEPTGCTDKIGFSCTFSHTTAVRLMANVNRDQYGKPDLTLRQAPFSAQMGMWWLYFKWQWLRDSRGTAPAMQLLLALGFLALGIYGGVTHWRYEKPSFWFFGPLVLTVTVALVYYMNFKYGSSQAPGLSGVAREVRDRDYFYLWSFSTWSVWAALGLAALWKDLAGRITGPDARRWMASSPILLFGLIPFAGNWRDASRARETATREWAHDLLNSVEPYGILVTLGDNDTFPLWYAQEVEGIRPDVTVAVTSLLSTDWYPRGLLRRKITPYDAAHGPAAYRNLGLPVPTKPILSLTIDQLNAIPEYVDVREPQIFQAGTLKAVVDPRRLEYGVPTRGDLIVLQFIKDNLNVRPVYIARTSGGYVQALGLEPYALVQGLAVKIMPSAVMPTADTLAAPGVGHIDVRRTLDLWNGYGMPKAVISRGDWVDRPSIGIPALYIGTASMIAEVLDRRADSTGSDRMRKIAMDLAESTRLMDFMQARAPSRAPSESGDGRAQQKIPIRP